MRDRDGGGQLARSVSQIPSLPARWSFGLKTGLGADCAGRKKKLNIKK